SNIKTPFDAVWWAFSTITTVGYGDRFPVTMEGKLVAIVLMIAGVSLFGVLTGLLAKLFLEPAARKEDTDVRELRDEVRLLRDQIGRLLPPPAEEPVSPALPTGQE
ncbi:MAG TPA: potassium channel family protein, partial [Verrucomicrobiales bacterium]|nr:potassium channel family protein [Verrucomicrobiales bacterium]